MTHLQDGFGETTGFTSLASCSAGWLVVMCTAGCEQTTTKACCFETASLQSVLPPLWQTKHKVPNQEQISELKLIEIFITL